MGETLVFWLRWLEIAFTTMPEFVGNNRVGAIFACVAVFFYERRSLYSTPAFAAASTSSEKLRLIQTFLMDHWRGTFRLWLYISIAFMVGHTLDLVRRDDTSLAESKLQLSGIVNGELARKEAAIGTITKEMDDKLSKERQSCAEMKGANGALEAQNKDQQNSINNCQNQAIARLQPLPFAFGVYRLDQFGPFDSGTKAHFLLTTNTTITHIGILATCNRPIKAALPWILTDTIPIGGEDKLIPPNKYSFSYGSPAWLPNNPIVFNVTYDGPGDIVCGFTRTS